MKEIQKKNKAEEEEIITAEKNRTERLLSIVGLVVLEKGEQKLEYQTYITYKFEYENKSDKDIRAVKGDVVFNDVFDDNIQTISLSYDKGIKAKEKKIYEASTNFNQFIPKDVRLRNKELKDLKILWKPEKIIFEDGSTLE